MEGTSLWCENKIDKILERVKTNQKYGIYKFVLYAIVHTFIIFLMLFILLIHLLYNLQMRQVIFLAIFILFFLVIFYKRRSWDKRKTITICTMISPTQIEIHPSPKGFFLKSIVYKFVAYYIIDNVKYTFKFIIWDDQQDLYDILTMVIKKGKLSSVKICVDENDMKKYKVEKYDFINMTIKENYEEVCKLLKYNYSKELNF